MKKTIKKSSLKSKSKKKSPLLKYLVGGPTLGSADYSGNDMTLMTPISPGLLPTDVPDVAPMTAEISPTEMASSPPPSNSGNSLGSVASGIGGAASGIGGIITSSLQDTSVADPSGYYSKDYKNKIEASREGAKTSSIVKNVGGTISAIAPYTGPAAPFLLAIGALTSIGGAAGEAGHKATEQKRIGDYAEMIADRQTVKRQAEKARKRNAAIEEQNKDYYSSILRSARYGGLMKYMGGGFTKVTGPSHENGGVPMDLSGDGVVDSELEGGEIIETMKGGGKSGQKYIWSDHLKKGGKSFAKIFEEMKRKGRAQAEIEGLRVDQEIAANRDPNMLYAKYGGMMKYQVGGTNTQYVGLDSTEISNLEKYKAQGMSTQDAMRKATLGDDDLTRRLKDPYANKISRPDAVKPEMIMIDRATLDLERMRDSIDFKHGGLWANIHAKQERIKKGSGEKMRKPGSEGAPTAKALRESKRDGGLMKYQTAGLSIDNSEVWQNDTLSPDFIDRPNKEVLSSDISKILQDDSLNPDFIDKEKQAKVYKELSIPKKKNGGLPKYQTAGTYTVQSGDTLSGIAQAQGVADYNEIYNLNKGVIGSDPNMIKPGQVLTMPGATPAAPASTGVSPLLGYAGVSPLAGYPGVGGGGYISATPYTRPSASSTAYTTSSTGYTPPPNSKSIRKALPYGIAAANVLGQIATVASINAKKGVAPLNVPYIKPPEKEFFTRVRDTGKAGREAERRATIREINKTTGPQKFALANQARATLLREEEKAKADIDAMNTKIEQAEITLNTSRKDSINFKNSELALQNAMSARNEALRVLESVNNKKKAYGDIFRGTTKDILQYYAAEEEARATEGERGVMGRFYNNPYDKFSKQYKKQNPGASPQETYAAYQTSLV